MLIFSKQLNPERKFTPFAPRDANGATSGIPVNSVAKPTFSSNGIQTAGSGTYNGSGENAFLARGRDTVRGEEMANGGGKDSRSGSLARDSSDINVGFSDLPNQIQRKAIKHGFEFTIMSVGEAGLGKSTLINSLFLTDIYSDEYPGPTARAQKTVSVESSRILLKERNVNLNLTIVDTPGFGGSVNNENCCQPIVDFIESRYEEYLNAESKLHRTNVCDNRVHCCLYFIAPSGHSLKDLDIECMKQLHDKVNIIPVIAKADTLTPEEIATFKKNILTDITVNNIKVYEFPDSDEESAIVKSYKSRIPFAVVGSNYVIESNGARKRGRKYPWGVVEIENLEHCDFIALRNLLIQNFMLDLVDTTNSVHYENYRCRKLSGFGADKKPNLSGTGNKLVSYLRLFL